MRAAGQGYELSELDREDRAAPTPLADEYGTLAPAWNGCGQAIMDPRDDGRCGASPLIYCVVPEALAGELYDKLAAYYAEDPNVDGHRRPPQGRAARRAAATGGAKAPGARPAPAAPGGSLPHAGGA